MSNIVLGLVATSLIVFFSMEKGSFALFFNLHSVIIVFGGTASVLIMSTPWPTLINLFRTFATLLRSEKKTNIYLADFTQLSSKKNLIQKTNNPLINYAAELWEQGIDADLVIVLLSQKKEELEGRFTDAIMTLRNLAKYPPALGMTGTVMGLVSLFSILGEDNKSALGPALALAMTATFFGLILANFIIMPISDFIQVRQIAFEREITNVYQILILINRNEEKALVEDEVNQRAAS